MPNPFIRRFPIPCLPVYHSLLLACLVLIGLLLAGCPTSNSTDSIDFARTPFGLHIDTVKNDHPFCQSPSAFANQAECEAARKFKISWDPPDDTSGLIGYRFYLDTNAFGDIPPKTTWTEIQKKPEYADVILTNTRKLQDSILFAVGRPKVRPNSLDAQNPSILFLDTSGRFPQSGSANMAIVPIYAAGHPEGKPTYGPAQIGDRYPPIPIQIETQVYDTFFIAKWERPVDAVSFFNPDNDSGTIREYLLNLRVTGFRAKVRAANFKPRFVYTVEGDTMAMRDYVPLKDKDGDFIGVQYLLPDGGRFHRVRTKPLQDQIALTVSGLTPLDTLGLQIVGIDLVGNRVNLSPSIANKIIMTDTTEPEKPALRLDSTGTTRNRLVLQWEPSRDSLEVDGKLQRAANPDQGIFQYRLRRELIEDSLVQSRKDTVFSAKLQTPSGFYTDSLVRLPPNKQYRFVLTAVDSSGHASRPDTLLASTLPVAFAPSESTLTCPSGFIPIPGKTIILGDTSTGAQGDERPGYFEGKVRQTYVSSFCMEPSEHRYQDGTFASDVSWLQADSICKSLSAADSTRLCSEAQWERACEGGDSLPHVYGYQGDRTDPSYLLGDCNQGTGDSVPAQRVEYRSKKCLTNEGVFDLPGEFSEWVFDSYDSLAYSKLRIDTLPYSFAFEGTNPSSHSFRGGNFLKPNIPSAQLQALARCSNRDLPRNVRPKFKKECTDTVPMILAFFGTTFDQHHCFAYPERAKIHPVSLVVPLLDSVRIVVSYTETNLKDTILIPRDTITKGKLVTSLSATTPSLAVVRYETPSGIFEDTLDAREFRDTSSVLRRKVIQREAGFGSKPVEVDGKPYVILLYSYSQQSSRPAGLNYSSKAIAFRCCAKPRAGATDPTP